MTPTNNFIKNIINEDLKANKNNGQMVTRFPPEPNGFLHIGHAKAICLNFGLAQEYHGKCHLRLDDTNPCKEETLYVESIIEDIKWLGFDWGKNLFYASNYFEKIYEYAIELIKKGKAYVCDLNADQVREYRGTLTDPGKESPNRNRSIEDNLDLFQKMKNGEFKEGDLVLRAKIDMKSPNINMRDPVIYRIMHETHHRTSDKWCIYPMYDFAHPLSDAIENITHSICTLEFEDHRPLYNWFITELNTPGKPQQIEFARLNLTYTVMSKRKLLELVKQKIVNGWDDPRMPTIAGLRRRGYTPHAIKTFCEKIGVAKSNSTVDLAMLEFCIREELNQKAARAMVVLDPLKIILTNYPENQEEWFEAENNPEDPSMGTKKIPFSKEIYIEQDDFMENPPSKFFRLAPGKEIRLKYAYYVTCEKVLKDETGKITELHCTYDPSSKGGWSNDGRKVFGTSHWVSAKHAQNIEVRLYENLFTKENPEEDGDFKTNINPNSLKILKNCKAEPDLIQAKPGTHFQFLRLGYFYADPKDSKPKKPVFNKIVGLKDTWNKTKF